MIGLDTNVIVRLFVDDDPKQARAARAFFAKRCSVESPGYINRISLCEVVWVLESVYGYKRPALADLLDQVLASSDIVVEDRGMVQAALQTFRSTSIDFADALIGEVNRAHGCDATVTFDQRAAKLDGFMAVA